MKITVENPVVLITGALAGIGRATAIALGQAGARVVVSVAANSKVSPWKPNCANSEPKLSSFAPTFAKRTM
jgi:NAD(P)-dependent dehydrogenase (short-subunit alcohol dehydrogenase family)